MWNFFPFKYLKRPGTKTDTDVLDEIVKTITYINTRTEVALKYIPLLSDEEVHDRCVATRKSKLECRSDLCYKYADKQLLLDIGEPYRAWLNHYYVDTGDGFWESTVTA